MKSMNIENMDHTKKILYFINRENLGFVYGLTQVTILGILLMTYIVIFFLSKKREEKSTVEKEEKVFDLEAKYLPISFIIIHIILFLLSCFYACEIYLGFEVKQNISFHYQQYCDMILILFNLGIHIILNDVRKNGNTGSLRKVFLFVIILVSLFFEIMVVSLDCFKVSEYSFFNLNSKESILYFILYVLKTLSISYIFASIFIKYPFTHFYTYNYNDSTGMGKVKMFLIKFQMMWSFFWPNFWIPRICFLICLILALSGRIVAYYLAVKTSDLIQILAFPNSIINTKELLKKFSLYGILLILQGNATFKDGVITNLINIAWQPIKNYILRTISIRVYAHAHGLPITWFLEKNTDSLGSLINSGGKTIDIILSQTIFNILIPIFDLITAMILFFNLTTLSSAIILYSAFVAYLFFSYLITDSSSKYSGTARAAASEAKTLALDALINYESVKTCGMENFEIKKYSENIENYGKAAFIESKFISLTNIAQNFIVIIGFFVGCAFCIRDIITKETGRIDLLIFITYSQQLYPSLSWLGKHLINMKISFKQIDEILNILREKTDNPVEDKDMNSQKFFESLEIKNLCFKYKDRMILKNVNLKFSSGEVVRIIGPPGSGKTTLLRLLSGLLDPTEGKIILNGIEISKENKGELRRIVSLVPQEVTLLNDSIKANIKYGNLKSSDDELTDIMQRFYSKKFFHKFTNGLDYEVQERGKILSEVEKQLIAWARAFINNPKIILVEEAKSCLNSSIIYNWVQEKMNSPTEKRSAVIVTHELQLLLSTDTIFFLTENGAYCGNHEELLTDKSNGYEDYLINTGDFSLAGRLAVLSQIT